MGTDNKKQDIPSTSLSEFTELTVGGTWEITTNTLLSE